jgi:hypothetical protein
MGEHTHYIQASYTASDTDALIEALRRVPKVYTLDLGLADTERMLGFLNAATPGNGDTPAFLGLRPQLVDWLNRYEDHGYHLQGVRGKGWPFTAWPDQDFKILLVTLYAAGYGAPDPMFNETTRDFVRELYGSILTTLDIELI